MIDLEKIKQNGVIYEVGGYQHYPTLVQMSRKKGTDKWTELVLCEYLNGTGLDNSYEFGGKIYYTKEEALEAEIERAKERLKEAEKKLADYKKTEKEERK